MSFDRFLSLLVILMIVLALIVVGALRSTVWVAPSEDDCQGKAHCGTIQILWQHSSYRWGHVNGSESNITFVFLPGIHNFNHHGYQPILFWGVSNIVLTGDEQCVRKKEQCTIKCTHYLCIFLFIDSQNITIQHLNVVYSKGSFLERPFWLKYGNMSKTLNVPCNINSSCTDIKFDSGNISGICNRFLPFNLVATSWIFVAVSDVHINSLHLFGYDSRISVYNPRGQFEVIGCHSSQLLPATTNQSPMPSFAVFVSHAPGIAETPESVKVLVSGCTFESDHYFPNKSIYDWHISEKFYNHHAVLVKTTEELGPSSSRWSWRLANSRTPLGCLLANVTIVNCTFLRTSGVEIHLSDSSLLVVTVQLLNSLVDGMVNRYDILNWGCNHLWLRTRHLKGSGVKVQVLIGNSVQHRNLSCTSPQTLTSVLIFGNSFKNLASIEGIGVILQTVYIGLNELNLCSCNCRVPIVIEDNIFTDNWGLRYGSIIDAARMWGESTSMITDCKQRPYKHPDLVLRNNSFNRNIAEFSRCLGYNIAPWPHENGHIYGRRWNTNESCEAYDPSKGIIHLSGYKGSHFAALVSNNISGNKVMGLSMIDSHVLFNGSNTLDGNYAPYGGGIFIGGQSQMLLMNGTQLLLRENKAAFTGGGIFVSSTSQLPKAFLDEWVSPNFCFFDLIGIDGLPARNITSASYLKVVVKMSDNLAPISGNSLFMASMSPCMHQQTLQNASHDFEVFHTVFHLPSYTEESEISSMPMKICSCNSSGLVSCSLADIPPIQVFPGQKIDLWLMIVGEADIILSGDLTLAISSVSHQVYKDIVGRTVTLLLRYNTRIINECNMITIKGESMAKITAGDYFILLSLPTLDNTPSEASKLNLLVSMDMTVLDHCPHGYNMINESSGQLCECHRVLQDNYITCHFNTLSFGLPPRYWIGAGTDNTSLLFSDSCLPSYCRDTYTSKEVFLSNLTQQCLHGRVGTLCGECPEGQSVVLGSYNCKTCSNYGILVAVVYLVAGPLVIVFICVFNWTVSARVINGLLLYLNIISINSDLLLHSNSFPFVVISWLNFRVGIEMCLFDGMDEFAKTILSFAFPLYLISLVVLIVMVSKCINMHRINKLIGPRITPVLATVILLSYTMLFDSVLKSLLFAQLCSSTDGACTPVWLLDGSLKYFSSTKHIILACLALVILFGLLIPITLTAVIGDLFRRCISNRWYMNFLDTFHSSYRFRWGFWIGLRLVMRIVLFLLKVTVKPEVVWLVTACFSLSLAAVQSLLKPFRHLRFDQFTHRLVDEWCSSEENGKTVANYLDISFLVNLTALFLSISYLPDSAEVFISLSLCVALIELLLILAYHLVEYSPLGPPLLTATTRAVERIGMFCQRLKHTEEQQCEPADNRQLLGLPLVLRAADCNDEDYESPTETTERETEQNADTH